MLDEGIEREVSGAAAEQNQQHGGPLNMGWLGLRVDEDLNDGCHAKKHQGGGPG